MADDDGLDEVQVIHRVGGVDRAAWMVKVDWSAKLSDLHPDLVRALLNDEPERFEMRIEGSLSEPVVVLQPSNKPRVGTSRPVSPSGGQQ